MFRAAEGGGVRDRRHGAELLPGDVPGLVHGQAALPAPAQWRRHLHATHCWQGGGHRQGQEILTNKVTIYRDKFNFVYLCLPLKQNDSKVASNCVSIVYRYFLQVESFSVYEMIWWMCEISDIRKRPVETWINGHVIQCTNYILSCYRRKCTVDIWDLDQKSIQPSLWHRAVQRWGRRDTGGISAE